MKKAKGAFLAKKIDVKHNFIIFLNVKSIVKNKDFVFLLSIKLGYR